MGDILNFFWRLVPFNPILLRVVATAGKRRRDLLIRCSYLGVLVLAVIFYSLNSTKGLAGLAATSTAMFINMSYLQLGLVTLLAPVFTAGAITQERDSQTYDILLTTPLTNGQIVLGSLLSRLFFVTALLLSGIPIFAMTQIFGGVAIRSIVDAFFIAAATAFVTGALAMAIAVLKVGTRRTIFGFYLFILLYLVLLFGLDRVPAFQIAGHSSNAETTSHISWFTGLQPFLALQSSLHFPAYTPPLLADLPENLRSWPFGWYFTDPAGFYTAFMFTISFALVLPSIILLRKMSQTTITPAAWLWNKISRSTGDRTRKPRTVWNNPVAWREAKTKGSAIRAYALRYSFIGFGVLGAIALVIIYAMPADPPSPKYIDGSSFHADVGDPGINSLTLYEPGSAPETHVVDSSTALQLDGKAIPYGQLHGRFCVANAITASNSDGTTHWGALDLITPPRMLSASAARQILLGATVVEFALVLLIITNVAASTVTREKEDGTLDLLLASPITSRFYIWGKLRGLVAFALPLVAVPVFSAAVFILYDSVHFLIQGNDAGAWVVWPEALLTMPGTLIIFCALAAIIGMHMSLRARKTVVAVLISMGIMIGVCAALGFCAAGILSSDNSGFGAVVGMASPFTLLSLEIDPSYWQNLTAVDVSTRIAGIIAAWVAVGIYAALVNVMYRSMVKNFDMTIRKQSR